MLEMQDVKKAYQNKQVVKGISLEVKKGEAFGLLGPNGAGKSTTISMISGLVPYDAGDILVDGISVKRRPMEIKQKIGVVPQDIALYPTMSAYDNLVFWGKMYGLTGKTAKARAKEVLQIVGLAERGKEQIHTFSGGMKRRINIGAALMHRPELLIMDEPTVGIDPQSRNHILETVKQLNQQGMTIIYTSHYMEEVEFLCERIAIMDHGMVIASGFTQALCNRLAGGTVLQLEVAAFDEAFLQALQALDSVENANAVSATQLKILIRDNKDVVAEIIRLAVQYQINIQEFKKEEANLESLFLQLTGRSLRD